MAAPRSGWTARLWRNWTASNDFSLNDIVLVPDAATDTQFVAGNYTDDVHGTAGDDSLAGGSDPTAWHLERRVPII